MDKVAVRIECLKLAAAQAREPAETLARAKQFESYIFEEEKQLTEVKPQKGQASGKKSGNPDPLS